MMSTMIGCFKPVGRGEYLERFFVLDVPTHGLPDELWDDVHNQVQDILRRLDEVACRQVPGVRVAAARTKGRSFLLFSYRRFEPPNETIDPAIVGIAFTASGNNVVVEGDISGEQLGDLIAELPNRSVASSKSAIVAAAQKVATELARFGDQLAAAICDEGRRFD